MTKLAADAGSLQITATGPAGEKLQSFQVLAGVEAGSVSADFQKRTGETVVNWQPHTVRISKGRDYAWSLNRTYEVMHLRLEADGYQPQIAGPIKKADGPQRIEFQLAPDRQVAGRILTPDRKPAAGATVALALVQKDAALQDGRLRGADQPLPEKPSDRWRRPLVVKADDEGRFKLPTEPGPAAVLVLHDSGVKELSYDSFRKSPEVVLDRWGRIEGRMLWKDTPGAGEEVTLSVHRDEYGYPGMIGSSASTRTDKEGRFTFERALPGQTQISRPLRPAPKRAAKGLTAIILPTQFLHVDVKPGEPTRILLGGQGRLVRGKLTGRDSWKGVTFHIHPTAPHIGFPGDDAAWQAFSELQKSPIGPLLFRDKQPVNADGTFEIADMLPGAYQLFVSAPDVQNYAAYLSVSIDPEVPGEKPVIQDLGEIKVKSLLPTNKNP
ncbi:MAG: hypothetical protein WD894_10040 [Pirellulales bacterium]